MKKCFPFMIILLLIVEVVVANAANDSLWIGIVRIDEFLVPIGTYNKGKWVNTWPETSIDEQPEVDKLAKATNGKMQLQDIPDLWKGAIKEIPAKVFLWSEGSRPKNLKVINAEKYESHCSGGWALKTNYQPTKEDKVSPTPKIGLATNYDSNVIPFVIISKESEDALSIVPVIKAKFEEKENVSRRISLKDRKKSLIKITRIYKTSREINGRNLYFIEAQRKYPKSSNAEDADCYNLNFLKSWVIMQNKEVSFLNSEFIVTDCDGKEMDHVVPDVVLSAQGRHYIVSENYGYEWEFYTINEILNGSITEVLRVDGGGC